MNNYKKQCLLVLCFFAVSIFANNASAMDFEDYDENKDYMVDENNDFNKNALYQGKQNNYCEDLRQRILFASSLLTKTSRSIEDLENAFDSADTLLISQRISTSDDSEKYYKEKREKERASLAYDNDVDTLNELIDTERELDDWRDQMRDEYRLQCV